MGRRKQWEWFAGIAVVIGSVAACSSTSESGTANNACTLLDAGGGTVLQCGSNEIDLTTGSATLGAVLVRAVPEAPGDNCENGGTRVDVGADDNGDGDLDSNEVEASEYACEGAGGGGGGGAGADGLVTLLRVTPEGPGANCDNGGRLVESGLDADGDGTLDAAEVSSEQYVCLGAPGATPDASADAPATLVRVSNEAAGQQCANGGRKIEIGLDDDRDALLDPEEIDDTEYVCNGADGPQGNQGIPGLIAAGSTVEISDEAPGAMCTEGGQKIEWGLDDDRDGELDQAAYGFTDAGADAGLVNASEVAGTQYVCNGAPGSIGDPALQSLVEVNSITDWYGWWCETYAGAQIIMWGQDDDSDGNLEPYSWWWGGEVDGWTVVCDAYYWAGP